MIKIEHKDTRSFVFEYFSSGEKIGQVILHNWWS